MHKNMLKFKPIALVTGIITFGAANSLLSKYQDNVCVQGCVGIPEDRKFFNQPVAQSAQMFAAEALCWLVYGIVRARESKSTASTPLISLDESSPPLKRFQVLRLALPAIFDIMGTTLMNVSLLLTPVSVFQMSRGAVVVFVALISRIVLGKGLSRDQWTGITGVVAGVAIVGASAASSGSSSGALPAILDRKVISGILMILLGQCFTASQFVSEELLLQKHSICPILLVAYEGLFGLFMTIIFSMMVFVLQGQPANSVFDLRVGFSQIFSIRALLYSSVAIMFSLASFNVCGLSFTRMASATSRSTIDTSRTVVIWLVSLLIGWEEFRAIQLLGFLILVYGTLKFNGVLTTTRDTP